jgi:inositol transport system substrate-binding protein
MRRGILGLLIATLVISMLAMTGCQRGGDGFTVGLVNQADSDVFTTIRMHALRDAMSGTDINIRFADADNNIQRQLDLVDVFILQEVDILVISPVDGMGVIPAVVRANEAGIPVILFGITAGGGDFVFIGSENYDAGWMQGELFARILPPNAQILYLAGSAGLFHSIERRDGFNDALRAAGRNDVVILSDMDGDYQMATAMRITEDWIQAFPHFDAIVAANDQMALGAVEALRAAGRLDGVLVSGIDGTSGAISAILDGSMVQSVLQNAPGQADAALEAINRIRAGQSVENVIMVPFVSITADNVGDFL